MLGEDRFVVGDPPEGSTGWLVPEGWVYRGGVMFRREAVKTLHLEETFDPGTWEITVRLDGGDPVVWRVAYGDVQAEVDLLLRGEKPKRVPEALTDRQGRHWREIRRYTVILDQQEEQDHVRVRVQEEGGNPALVRLGALKEPIRFCSAPIPGVEVKLAGSPEQFVFNAARSLVHGRPDGGVV